MTYSDNLLAMQEQFAKSQLLHEEVWDNMPAEIQYGLIEEQEWKAKIALAHSDKAEEDAFEAAREKTNEFDEYAQIYHQSYEYQSFTDYKNRKL